MIVQRIEASSSDEGRRLDRVLRRLLPTSSIGDIYVALRTGTITLNGRRTRHDYRLHSGDSIELPPSVDVDALADDISETGHDTRGPVSSGRVLFHNRHIIAINKPVGMLMQGERSCLTIAESHLAEHPRQNTDPQALGFRCGALHRLDRNTSGIVLFSASLRGAQVFSRLLHERQVEKGYLALMRGHLTHPMVWSERLRREYNQGHTIATPSDDGKTAETLVQPLVHSADHFDVSLCLCRIPTGRTHQIRAQAKHHGHPLVGDLKYGGWERAWRRYLLHAWYLDISDALRYPDNDAQELGFRRLQAPLPQQMYNRLAAIFGEHRIKGILQRCPTHRQQGSPQ